MASNVSEQEVEPYLNAFRQKYPGIQVDYTCYSDYENEIGEQIASGDYPDVLFIPGSISSENYADYFEPLGTKEDLGKNMITCRAARSLKIRYTGSRHPHM